MPKVHIFVAGNTLDCHKKFITKLKKKGVKIVDSPMAGSNVTTIVFCPIVSRYETDINSALSSAEESGCKKVILVAMHHTFDKDYTLPNSRQMNNRAVILHVDCLFHETKGFLSCTRNKNAVKMVRKELSSSQGCFKMRKARKNKTNPTPSSDKSSSPQNQRTGQQSSH